MLMNILMTGSKGTLGQVLAGHLQNLGHQLTAWDRQRIHPLDLDHQAFYLDEVKPDALMHLAIAAQPTGADNEGWRVNVEWSEHLARLCAVRGIPLVFTSTALVFNNDVSGPFNVNSPANASEGYGQDKRIAEERVRAANAEARIVRLGWQIGSRPEGNNMLAWCAQQQRENGFIGASTRWLPACSFLPDTAAALARLLQMAPGLYMADSNGGYSFFDILLALREHVGSDWIIKPNEDYVYDQRLQDPSLPLPDLGIRLPQLRSNG